MKTIEAFGMKRPVCANCFEYPENCVGCEWHRCAICHEELTDSECYEYRGAYACQKHFEEMTQKRDEQREKVMELTEKSVRSQMDGQWANGGYKTMKTDPHTGRPMGRVREPLSLQDYENGNL